MELKALAALLNATETKNGYQAKCPCHDDTSASLSLGRDGCGKILMHCHAGCDTPDIVKKINIEMSDLFPDKTSNVRQLPQRIVGTYDYTDEVGKILLQVVRYGPKKDFRQRKPDGDGWAWSAKGCRQVPYRLPELIAAPITSDILILEGEKDVANAVSRGAVATCNAGGAGKWKAEWAPFFAGRTVIIIPDNDVPGRKHAEDVATKLGSAPASVRIVPIPDGQGKDLSDWVGAGHTIPELLAQVPAVTRTSEDIRTQNNPARETHLGNAERLIELCGEDLAFTPELGWLGWDGIKWGRGDTQAREAFKTRVIPEIYRECADAALNRQSQLSQKLAGWGRRSESFPQVRGCLDMAQTDPAITIPIDAWDADPWLMGTRNGHLDLRTGKHYPPDRSKRITRSAGVAFNSDAKCYRWEAFLDEIFSSDAELIDWIRRVVGYSLTGDIREQCWFILFGGGRNGKSTFIKILLSVLGDYGLETPASTIMLDDRASGVPNDIARLRGCRLATCNETDDGQRLSEARIKQMTGGDLLSARFLHQEFFQFAPQFKIFLRTNHRPAVRGTDMGLWRRVKLIPFYRNFEGPADDKNLTEDLLRELPGIVNWAVRGCLEWQKLGLDAPNAVKEATGQYRSDSDTLGKFLKDCCSFSIAETYKSVKASLFYRRYIEWAEAEGEKAFSQKRLVAVLYDRGVKTHRGNDGSMVYDGVCLLEQ